MTSSERRVGKRYNHCYLDCQSLLGHGGGEHIFFSLVTCVWSRVQHKTGAQCVSATRYLLGEKLGGTISLRGLAGWLNLWRGSSTAAMPCSSCHVERAPEGKPLALQGAGQLCYMCLSLFGSKDRGLQTSISISGPSPSPLVCFSGS